MRKKTDKEQMKDDKFKLRELVRLSIKTLTLSKEQLAILEMFAKHM